MHFDSREEVRRRRKQKIAALDVFLWQGCRSGSKASLTESSVIKSEAAPLTSLFL